MTASDKPGQAPEEPLPGKETGPSVGTKGRKSLSKSRRELTEEELGQSGVRLMLLDEVDRLEEHVAHCEVFEARFHELDKANAVLVEKRRRDITVDVVYGICSALGSGCLFLIPSLAQDGYQRQLVGVVGVVLLACAIVIKVRAK